MSLAAVLFVIFLVLKLTGLIAWSWVWVTAPLWIPAIVVLVAALFGVSVVGRADRRARERHEALRKRHGIR